MDNETLIMQIVAFSGEANSRVYDALEAYSEHGLEASMKLLDEAEEMIVMASRNQFQLLNQEANGNEITMTVLLTHAMDICTIASNQIQYTKNLLTMFDKRKKVE